MLAPFRRSKTRLTDLVVRRPPGLRRKSPAQTVRVLLKVLARNSVVFSFSRVVRPLGRNCRTRWQVPFVVLHLFRPSRVRVKLKQIVRLPGLSLTVARKVVTVVRKPFR